jgi:hypothetical protein
LIFFKGQREKIFWKNWVDQLMAQKKYAKDSPIAIALSSIKLSHRQQPEADIAPTTAAVLIPTVDHKVHGAPIYIQLLFKFSYPNLPDMFYPASFDQSLSVLASAGMTGLKMKQECSNVNQIAWVENNKGVCKQLLSLWN